MNSLKNSEQSISKILLLYTLGKVKMSWSPNCAQSYNPASTNILAHLPTFAVFFGEIYNFLHFLQFNVVYRDEVVIACLQQRSWGKGVHCSSDVIR